MAEIFSSTSAEEPTADDDPITDHAVSSFVDGSTASAKAADVDCKTSFVPLLFSTPPTTTTTTPTNIPSSDSEQARRCGTITTISSKTPETVAMIDHTSTLSSHVCVSAASIGAQPPQNELLHVGKDEALSAAVALEINRMQECEPSSKDEDHERHARKITPTLSAAAADNDGEKVEIFLETPVAETHQQHYRHHSQQKDNSLSPHHQDVLVVVDAAATDKNIELLMVVEASVSESNEMKTKPKRLSDEFFSADDGSDADNEYEEEFVPMRLIELIGDEDSHPDAVKLNMNSMQATNTPISVANDQVPDAKDSFRKIDEESLRIIANFDFSVNVDRSSSQAQKHLSESPTPIAQNSIPNAEKEVPNHGDELNEHDVHSMDAIERRDIEEEHKITGGCLMRCRKTKKSPPTKSPKVASPPAQPAGVSKMATTPTSSRTKIIRFGVPSKSTASAKINLSESLDKAVNEIDYTDATSTQRPSKIAEKVATEAVETVSSIVHSLLNKLGSVANVDSIASSSTSNSPTTMSAAVRIRLSQQPQKYEPESFFNCTNSNDSSDASNKSGQATTITPSAQTETKGANYSDGDATTKCPDVESDISHLAMACSSSKDYTGNASTSCSNFHSNVSKNSLSNCSYSHRSSAEENNMDEDIVRRPADELVVGEEEVVPAIDVEESHASQGNASAVDSSSVDALEFKSRALLALENDHDYEEDTWADCEETYEAEEICTCRDYSDDEAHASSEDELPSRDVDLSGYTQLDTISEDILPESSTASQTSDSTPRASYRKRRLTESIGDSSPRAASGDSTPGKRKRLIIETMTSPQQNASSPTSSNQACLQSPSVLGSNGSERRTPRSMLIPTRDNPPPELSNWLLQFQRWSHVERLLATDRLIEYCEPSQVRHMMKVIEPQFQRDFISLLPKELALQVLSFLDPRDLLRAAQTCRSWRFLCDDNLLWKEKCKQSNILTEPKADRPKRGRTGNMPHILSPWKAAYMRQTIIEMNWRSRPIRDPKVLRGHDDHVITCLQFCGNRIVSGSDDNTLKVWSAVSGRCLRTLIGHTGGVWSSQMSENCVISGSTDRTLKVWNVETGRCTHTLYGHTSTVRCMHLHGNKVVSGSRDATLRVWDVIQGKCLHILVGHLAAVRCVQYDGKLVVSGAYDYMVKVWNPERQECLHTLQGHTNRVYSLQFDGVHVVSGSLDTSIRVWDAETGSCKHTLMGHQSLTSGMELRQNILVSGNADSTVKVWDITNGQCLQTLSGPNKHQSAVTCLQFNSRFVVTSSDDGTVKLWDVRTGDFIRNLVSLDSGGSGGVVWRIRSSDTKLICAVGSRNGTEETKLMVLDFDVEGACVKCS